MRFPPLSSGILPIELFLSRESFLEDSRIEPRFVFLSKDSDNRRLFSSNRRFVDLLLG